jgi:hypothetical protein
MVLAILVNSVACFCGSDRASTFISDGSTATDAVSPPVAASSPTTRSSLLIVSSSTRSFECFGLGEEVGLSKKKKGGKVFKLQKLVLEKSTRSMRKDSYLDFHQHPQK